MEELGYGKNEIITGHSQANLYAVENQYFQQNKMQCYNKKYIQIFFLVLQDQVEPQQKHQGGENCFEVMLSLANESVYQFVKKCLKGGFTGCCS